MAVKSYILKGDMPMRVGGKVHNEGDIVKMEEEDAQRYVDADRFEAKDTDADAKAKAEAEAKAKAEADAKAKAEAEAKAKADADAKAKKPPAKK